jgi:hypothetical protein
MLHLQWSLGAEDSFTKETLEEPIHLKAELCKMALKAAGRDRKSDLPTEFWIVSDGSALNLETNKGLKMVVGSTTKVCFPDWRQVLPKESEEALESFGLNLEYLGDFADYLWTDKCPPSCQFVTPPTDLEPFIITPSSLGNTIGIDLQAEYILMPVRQ